MGKGNKKAVRNAGAATHVLVTTHGHENLFRKDDRAYVHAGESPEGTVVVKKYVADLAPGDMVLQHGTAAKASLDEIDRALREDDLLYRHSIDQLFVTDANGVERPRLQQFLFDALAKKSPKGIDASKLDQTHQRRLAAAYLSERLSRIQVRFASKLAAHDGEKHKASRSPDTIGD